jgi:hypothetical protein
MKDPKDHLNIDLDFLDKKDPIRVAPKPETNTKDKQEKVESKNNSKESEDKKTVSEVSTDVKYNWKKILIVGGIILFFGWAIFSGSDDSGSSSNSNSYSSNSNATFTDESGQTFRCSDYRYDQAMAMKPTQTESDLLDSRVSASQAEKSRIENMYVDEYDQDSIDSYNSAVDSFNYKNNRLKSDLAAWDAKVNAYNNYLDSYCTPE